MKMYLESALHLPVTVMDFKPKRPLPLFLLKGYSLFKVTIGGVECIFAEPEVEVNISSLRKQQKAIERLLETRCVLYLPKATQYAKACFIEENIPFVIANKQIYLPFLGLVLDSRDERRLKPCTYISFLTQKLLLISIYEKWYRVSVSQAAVRLAVTKTSITRCYDEIEALKLPYLQRKSRARLFSAADDVKRMWAELQGILRNPVLQSIGLKNAIEAELPLGGLSALSFYSMLGENSYPIYAVAKQHLSKLDLDSSVFAANDENPACVLQEVGYEIPFGTGAAADPLSVALTLTEEDLDDPRVEKSMEEMLEDIVWSRA